MEEYLRILARVDAWYQSVKDAHPDRVPCSRGCRDCCLGLFDISLADRDLLREGLAKADPAVRRDIQARAAAILGKLRAIYPDLPDTLDGWEPDEIDDLCDALGDVECPVLGPDGECRLYAHRPLTCRMAGVPVVDVTGAVVAPQGCAKCTLPAGEAPRLDCDALHRDERKLLRSKYPGKGGVPLLIPQAVAPDEGPA